MTEPTLSTDLVALIRAELGCDFHLPDYGSCADCGPKAERVADAVEAHIAEARAEALGEHFALAAALIHQLAGEETVYVSEAALARDDLTVIRFEDPVNYRIGIKVERNKRDGDSDG